MTSTKEFISHRNLVSSNTVINIFFINILEGETIETI
jgi:hypothetical protein